MTSMRMMQSADLRITRGAKGLIDIEAFRKARQAAAFLTGCLHDPLWLREMFIEPTEDGSARIVFMLAYETEHIRLCLPSHINGLDVVLRVVG